VAPAPIADIGASPCLGQAPEGGKFLKGLAVLDDVAYFGVSTWAPRDVRASPHHACEIAAYDLNAGRLIWRRRVETGGLLNVIAAPHLGEEGSYRGVYSGAPLDERGPAAAGAGGMVAAGGGAAVGAAVGRLERLGYPPQVLWGVQPPPRRVCMMGSVCMRGSLSKSPPARSHAVGQHQSQQLPTPNGYRATRTSPR
jgi:hypothetical protein